MVASILAKKLAAGSTHLLIDIPVGPTAKVRHRQEALALRKLFEYVGDNLGLHLEVLLTDGSQPIGRGHRPGARGPRCHGRPAQRPERPSGPAGQVPDAGRAHPGSRPGGTRRGGLALATTILTSGQALARMEAVIEAQGRNLDPPPLGSLRHEVPAQADGVVRAIDNLQIARIARLAGAPLAKGAGVDLFANRGSRAAGGGPLRHLCRVPGGLPLRPGPGGQGQRLCYRRAPE